MPQGWSTAAPSAVRRRQQPLTIGRYGVDVAAAPAIQWTHDRPSSKVSEFLVGE